MKALYDESSLTLAKGAVGLVFDLDDKFGVDWVTAVRQCLNQLQIETMRTPGTNTNLEPYSKPTSLHYM